MNDPVTPSEGTDGPLQVLLVEDNPGDARLFAEYLDESGTEVALRHEQTLEAALSALADTTPDVLVVDLGLPDSEGTETVKSAATAAPSVPIVVLTGQGDLQAALRAQEAGATEYLQKDELTPALAGRTLQWAAQRTRMEAKIRQRDAWIRSITESVSAGVFRLGPTGRIEYANDALVGLLGFDAEAELLGVDLTTLYVDPAKRGQLLAAEGAEGLEIEFERQDGSTFIGLLSAEATRGEDGTIRHYDGVITDITEQKEAQRELERSEELTRSVLDALAANVSVLDGDGTIIDVNEQWAEFGRENEGDLAEIGVGTNYLEVCNTSGEEATSPIPSVEENLRAVIGGEEAFFEHEYPCHSPEEKRWFLLRATPLDRDEGGAVVAHIDVTERVQAVRRQRMLSAAVEQAKESVLITEATPLDEPGPRIEYVNSAFEEMTGYTEEEVLGTTPRILQGPKTDRAVLDALREALESGEPWQGETFNYRKDETPYVVQWNVAPVRNEEGSIEHWVSVQRDVTEQREREAQMKQMTQALEQVDDKVFITDPDGKIQYVNEAFEDVTGYREEEVVGKTPSVLTSEEHNAAFYEELWATIQSGETFRAEFINETKNGTRYIEDQSIAPVTDEEGTITHFVSSGRDITERKEAEEALREREAQLRGVANTIPGVVYQYFVQPDGTEGFRFIGERAEDLLNLSPDPEGFLDRFVERVPSSHRPDLLASIDEAIEEAHPWHVEIPFDKPSGERIWLLGTSTPEEREDELLFNGVLLDITQRKEAEHELQRQNDLFKRAQEIASVGAWEYDVQADEALWSEEVYRIHGLPPDAEASPETSLDFYHPDDRPRIREAFRRATQDGEAYDLELRLKTAAGDQRWVRTSGEPHVEDGTVRRVRGTIQDVTERKRREEDVRRRQEKIEALYTATDQLLRAETRDEVGAAVLELIGETMGYPGVVVRFVRNGKLVPVHASPNIQDFMPERPPFDVTGSSIVAEVYREHETALINDLGTVETPHDYGDARAGAAVPMGSHGVIGVTDEKPNAIEQFDLRLIEVIAAHATAVLDGIEQIKALRESEQRFRKLFAEAPIGIARVDLEGHVIETNAAFQDTLGYSADALRGRHFRDFTYEADVDHAESYFGELVGGERSRYTIEKRYRRGDDGRVFWARVTVSLLQHQGETQVIGMVQDIDDQKKYQEELREAKEEAERMNRLKSAFLANMSHEIRTPLTSILGFAEAIGDAIEEDEDSTVAQFSRLIAKSGQRLMETLNGVLNLSKLEAGEMDLSLEPVNLVVKTKEIVEQSRPQAQDAEVDLEVEAGEDPVWAQVDEGGLRIVVGNLVSNAIKYTPEGGHAWIRVREESDAAVIEVEDTGIGMEPSEVSTLFEAFKQESEGVGREYEGTGLGLAVTRKALKQMGGSIDVETEKGEGSRFVVRLAKPESTDNAADRDPGSA